MKKFSEFKYPASYYIEKAIDAVKGKGYYENAEEIVEHIKKHCGAAFSISTVRDCVRAKNTVKNIATMSNGACRCIYFHKSDTGKIKGVKA